MPVVGGGLSGFSVGTANVTVDISSVPVGAWMIATLFQEGTYQTSVPPTGWTNLLENNSQLSGTRAQAYAGRIKEAGDNSVTWGPEFPAQSGGRRLAVLWGTAGAPVSNWTHGLIGVRNAGNEVSGQSIQAGTGTTSVAPPVTVVQDNSLVVAILSEATSAAGTFSITDGDSTPFFSSGDSDVIQWILSGSLGANGGTTTAVTATGNQTQAANGQRIQIAIPHNDEPVGGAIAYDGEGNEVRVYSTTEVGPVTPVLAPVKSGFNDVATMLTTPGFTWAHRGLTTFAEESLYAYTRAVIRGHGALEVSLGRTSDGVWVATHDNDLNRVTGSTDLPAINTMTWAQVQALQISVGLGAPRPLMRWEEIRDAYGDTHVLVLDPKNYNWGIYLPEFLDMCDELGPTRVVVKQYASDVNLATAAAGRGYITWGHTFDDFMDNPNLNDYLAAWDLLGIEYGASQDDWDILLATGKPVVGHVADNQEAYNTAMSKGASGVQCTAYDIEPVSS